MILSTDGGGVELRVATSAWTQVHRVCRGRWPVSYRTAGIGPPVVLIHGLGVSADYWVRNGPPLAAAGFRVLAPDLPGFGRTDGPGDGLTIPEQAAAVERWAESAGVDRAVFVGHSISTQAVLELAARWPARVRALILASPTGEPGRGSMARQAWRLARDLWREPPSLIPIVALAYLRAGPRRFWRTWRAATQHDPLGLLHRIHAPARVILGADDPVVDLDFARRIAEGLPHGSLTLIEGGAHAVHFDRASAFNASVVDFLREVSRNS